MSSSLRNAVKRKTHKERSQPSERRRLGLLEKHKDYQLRARDYHRKEDALKVLRNKAALRNPDEFYFAMQNERTRDGVHVAKSSQQQTYTHDELQLMKTQDAGYINMKMQSEAKKVERLSAALHRVDAPSVGKKTVFADDRDEALQIVKQRGATADAPRLDPNGTASRAARGAHRELEQRRGRLEKLQTVSQELATQRALMGKGSKRKLKPGESGMAEEPVYRFKAQRKR